MRPYKYVGRDPDSLANGRPVVYGDVVRLTRQDVEANARLVDEGRLLPLPRKTTSTKETDR